MKNAYNFTTGFTPDTQNESFYDDCNGGYVWASIADLGDKIVLDSKKHISDKYIILNNPTITKAGDLLYSFKLSVGIVSFAGVDMYTNEAIASFDVKNTNRLDFLYFSSVNIVKNANENIYGAKLLNSDLISNAVLPLPPEPEQQVITNYLESFTKTNEATRDNLQRQIELLKEKRVSIISSAVTGNVKVA